MFGKGRPALGMTTYPGEQHQVVVQRNFPHHEDPRDETQGDEDGREEEEGDRNPEHGWLAPLHLDSRGQSLTAVTGPSVAKWSRMLHINA